MEATDETEVVDTRLVIEEEHERGVRPGMSASSSSMSSTVAQWRLDEVASEDMVAMLSVRFLVACLVLVRVCLPFRRAGIVLEGRLSAS